MTLIPILEAIAYYVCPEGHTHFDASTGEALVVGTVLPDLTHEVDLIESAKQNAFLAGIIAGARSNVTQAGSADTHGWGGMYL